MCRGFELQQLICGRDDVDLHLLQQVTQYDDGYSADHPTIRDFWAIMTELGPEVQKNLLHFVTASDRIPLKGIATLTFVIQRNGPDSDRLPTAQTCFGRLLLPEYANKEKLRDRLQTALQQGRGFGLA